MTPAEPGVRLVTGRLWPVLTVLGALLAAAVVLEAWPAARGNREQVIEIRAQPDPSPAEDEEATAGGEQGGAEPPALDEAHGRARLAARRAQFREAIPLFEESLRRHPASAQLQGELGFWLMAAGEPRQALPHLEKASAAEPREYRHALNLGLALSRLAEGARAERELRRALELRPGSGAARVALGRLFLKRGAHAEAIEFLAAAAASGGNEERARALAALGQAYLEAGRRAEAEKAFDQAILYAPANPDLRVAIARAWLGSDAKEDQARALAVLARAVELAPDLPQVHSALGRAQEKTGDLAAAEISYERALRLEPSYRYARRRLLRMALARRDFSRARAESERLLRDAPEVPEHHFLAGLAAEREGRRDEARRHYQQAVQRAGGAYPEAWLNLGVLEKNARNWDKSRAAYQKALQLRPGYLAALNNLGSLAEAEGKTAAAEAAYRQALAIDASHAPAWQNLGELLMKQGKLDAAVDAFRKAIAARPGYTAARLNLGVSLARAGRLDEAAATYRELLQRNPRYVAAWFNLALALDRAGKAGEARAALDQALEADPEHLGSLRLLAELHAREGRLAEARRVLEEVLDREPGDQAALEALAGVLARQGERQACLDRVRALAAAAPRHPRLRELEGGCGRASAGR